MRLLAGSPLDFEGINTIEISEKKAEMCFTKSTLKSLSTEKRGVIIKRLYGNGGIRLACEVKSEFAWKNITYE